MVLRIYDFLHGHRMLRWGVLVVSTIIMVLGASTLSYREDIADFLPLDSEERQTMDIYQDISGAGNLAVIFENASGEDSTMLAVDAFVQAVQERDTMGWGRGMLATINMESLPFDETFYNSRTIAEKILTFIALPFSHLL